jgi:hypothetical protein
MDHFREKGSSTTKILLIVFGAIGGVLLLMVVVCGGLIYWGVNTFGPAFTAVQDSAEAFVQDIHAGRIQAAYNRTSSKFQAQSTLPQFQAFVAQFPALATYTSLTKTGIHVNSTPAGTQGIVSYSAVGPNNSLSFRLTIVEENGQWRVQAMNIP